MACIRCWRAAQGPLLAPTPLTLAETASRVRRDADLPGAARPARPTTARAQGAARRQGRGHAEHGGAPDRVLSFERKVHEERRQGELTPERIGEIWMEVQTESLGAGHRASRRATRCSGPTSRTSSIRRSTSMPMPSAIAW